MVKIGFLDVYFLGARLFYWLYLFLTLLGAAGVVIYWNRERIKAWWYRLRFPERVLICILIYPGGRMREFWRLIPDQRIIKMADGSYLYNSKTIANPYKTFTVENSIDPTILETEIDGQLYRVDNLKKLRHRWDWPKMFWYYGDPNPIDFQASTPTDVKVTTTELEAIEKQTLAKQLIEATAEGGLSIWIFLLLLVVLIGVGVILAKQFGAIQ